MELAIFSSVEIDNPNQRESCDAALHAVAEESHPHVIRFLIKKGAMISAQDTRLYSFARCGNAPKLRSK